MSLTTSTPDYDARPTLKWLALTRGNPLRFRLQLTELVPRSEGGDPYTDADQYTYRCQVRAARDRDSDLLATIELNTDELASDSILRGLISEELLDAIFEQPYREAFLEVDATPGEEADEGAEPWTVWTARITVDPDTAHEVAP